jgi:transcriptional regulator with XRE-family HTH domain
MPETRGDAAPPPMSRDVRLDPKRALQRTRAAQQADEGTMSAHTEILRLRDVWVKECNVDPPLDAPPYPSDIKRMSSGRPKKSDAQRDWERKVGLRLRWVREAADWSQEYTAQKLEINQQWLSQYERGIRAVDPWVALRFCARMRTTLDYVYRGRLEGSHPSLVRLLLEAHPELNQKPTHTETGTDRVRSEYREAIE